MPLSEVVQWPCVCEILGPWKLQKYLSPSIGEGSEPACKLGPACTNGSGTPFDCHPMIQLWICPHYRNHTTQKLWLPQCAWSHPRDSTQHLIFPWFFQFQLNAGCAPSTSKISHLVDCSHIQWIPNPNYQEEESHNVNNITSQQHQRLAKLPVPSSCCQIAFIFASVFSCPLFRTKSVCIFFLSSPIPPSSRVLLLMVAFLAAAHCRPLTIHCFHFLLTPITQEISCKLHSCQLLPLFSQRLEISRAQWKPGPST